MSISLGHRAIFSAFGHRNSSAVRAHAPSGTVSMPVQAPTEQAIVVEAGELKCSPWEGLYLEQARPVTRADDEPAAGRPLDAFLTSLMYGE